MATAIAELMTSTPNRTTQNIGRCFLKETKYEVLKNLRIPIYSLSTVGFPVMFYVLFGLLLNQRSAPIGGTTIAAYLIASYGTFGVMGASLFGTGAGLAVERGLGWMLVKRASPMPPIVYFAAKFVMSMIFSTATVVLLMLLGFTFGGVRLPWLQALELLATLVAGSIPFCAMGLAIGYFAGPNSAPATINLIYLPMSFFSGLWVPAMFLPRLMQKFAVVLPPYHLSQLALGIVGAGRPGSAATHWEVLLAFTLLCLGVARIGFQRDEGKLYG
jgi:ABC-2 type transport system permease protein